MLQVNRESNLDGQSASI